MWQKYWLVVRQCMWQSTGLLLDDVAQYWFVVRRMWHITGLLLDDVCGTVLVCC
jgi:hypothetical protein